MGSLNTSLLGFPKKSEGACRLVLKGSFGVGTSATKIHNLGSAIICEDTSNGAIQFQPDSVNGGVYTINQSGLYFVQYNWNTTGTVYSLWTKNLPSKFWAVDPDVSSGGTDRAEYASYCISPMVRNAANTTAATTGVTWLNQGDELRINTQDSGTYVSTDTVICIERLWGL